MGGLNKRTPKQKGWRPPLPPTPQRGFDGRMNPILPPLQPNWTNLLTHVFIYIEKATPEGETHTHSWNRSLSTLLVRIKACVTRASTGNRAKINAAQQDATSVKETRWQYEVPGDSTMREMEQCTIFLPIQWWSNTSSNLRYSVLIRNGNRVALLVSQLLFNQLIFSHQRKKNFPSSSIQKSSVYFKSQNFCLKIERV